MPRAKKEDVFYTMFKDFAADIVKVAEDYDKLVQGYPDTANMIPMMKVHEDRCDEHVKRIMEQLYSAFITPFDRDDINDLALRMDDIVDTMEAVAIRLDLFNVSGKRTEAVQLADLTLAAARELKVMFDHFPDYKTDRVVMEKAISVGHIEDEGDTVYESAVSRLFHEDNLDEFRRGHVVSWLYIFDRMELCLDSCDAAAGVVRSVVMKSA